MRPVALLLFALSTANAASPPGQAARKWRQSHEHQIVKEYIELLSIPNVARNIDDMRRNAAHIRTMMERRGVTTKLLEVPNAPAAIYGELLTPGATQTVMFY